MISIHYFVERDLFSWLNIQYALSFEFANVENMLLICICGILIIMNANRLK